eukprot:gnl/TRDRNA2_/TRDRNA2_188487_c0_seq1.p1 gnl/TRDRNA2_/TRDRNA2_188487_c0~~gnl/TRDRNA2_/TRDRNA2_188487_c0_seq1.p1  ORF type:complete len:136 (-),score=13.34 gnl/TRDRNA2_/TRDRNA2_188487_c0_seq1:116-523(-)
MDNLRVAIALLLVLPCSTARVAPKSQFNLRHHRNTSGVMLSHEMAELSKQCKCDYVGYCKCGAYISYMKCMEDGCKPGGACPNCPADMFEKTCRDWSWACNTDEMDNGEKFEITCSKKTLTCEEGQDSKNYGFPM